MPRVSWQGIALALMVAVATAGCVDHGARFVKDPQSLRMNAITLSAEPIFDTTRAPSVAPPAHEMLVRLQNDSTVPITFAKFDKTSNTWIGVGMTAALKLESDDPLLGFTVDYSPLSQCRLWPLDHTSPDRAIRITVQPHAGSFTNGELQSAKIRIVTILVPQDDKGQAYPVTRTIELTPQLLFIGVPYIRTISAGAESPTTVPTVH